MCLLELLAGGGGSEILDTRERELLLRLGYVDKVQTRGDIEGIKTALELFHFSFLFV